MATRKIARSKTANVKTAALAAPLKSLKAAPAPAAPLKPLKPAPVPIAKAGKDPAKAKPELVRDSFKMPKNEYVLIEKLKQRALASGRSAKKSEILRAGVNVLSRMPDLDLIAALAAVPSLKTGRPKDQPKPAKEVISKKK